MTTQSTGPRTNDPAGRLYSAAAEYLLCTWETEYTSGGGIAAVVKQQRRHADHLLIIAPWHGAMSAAQNSPLPKNTQDTGIALSAGPYTVHVVITNDGCPVPIVFLKIDGCFTGTTPYDSPDLDTDTLVFGLAVDAFVQHSGTRPGGTKLRVVWGQDWETVPALLLCKQRGLKIALTLHNAYDDNSLKTAAAGFGAPYNIFGGQKALRTGLDIADIVTVVNRGFLWGLKHEPFHTAVFAPQLNGFMDRAVPVDNASFTPLGSDERHVLNAFSPGDNRGAGEFREIRERRRAALTKALEKPEIAEYGGFKGFVLRDKLLIGVYGRPVSQKLHSAIADAITELFRDNPAYISQLAVVFLVLPPESPAGAARIAAIENFRKEFPQSVACYAGTCPVFGEIRAAADFTVMPSLWEPHGEAFYSLTLPIVRAVDGLAAQVCDPEAEIGPALEMWNRWHDTFSHPTGFTFREDLGGLDKNKILEDFQQLLDGGTILADNAVYARIARALAKTIKRAVDTVEDRERWARMVRAALERQERCFAWDTHWEIMKRLFI